MTVNSTWIYYKTNQVYWLNERKSYQWTWTSMLQLVSVLQDNYLPLPGLLNELQTKRGTGKYTSHMYMTHILPNNVPNVFIHWKSKQFTAKRAYHVFNSINWKLFHYFIHLISFHIVLPRNLALLCQKCLMLYIPGDHFSHLVLPRLVGQLVPKQESMTLTTPSHKKACKSDSRALQHS